MPPLILGINHANMKKVTVIMEKAGDGSYSCYAEETFECFGLAGYGENAEEAKKDFLESYEDMKELEAEEGRTVPEMEFVFRYDIQSFFSYFSFLNMSKVAEKAGINPSLMRQYASGAAKAGQKQYDKLSAAVRSFGKELSEATF